MVRWARTREILPLGAAEPQDRLQGFAPLTVGLGVVEHAILLRDSPQDDVAVGRLDARSQLIQSAQLALERPSPEPTREYEEIA